MIKRYFYVNNIFRKCNEINNKLFKENNNSPNFELEDLNKNSSNLKFGHLNNDKYGLIAKSETQIKFNKEEDIIGNSFLQNIGIKKDQRFVCLLARDASYKKKYQSHIKDDWSYHNYRNVDIDTYEKAVQYLLDKDYFVMRMGKSAEKKLNIKNDYFLDYAFSEYRDDFLDLWLMANCYFAISTGSGVDMISFTHNVPVVYANYDLAQYMPIWSRSIIQPKKILNIKDNKILNLYEHLDFNISHIKKNNKYNILNYKYIDLNSEQILDLVKEMHLRLNNKYDNKNSFYLQKKFFNKLKKFNLFNEYFSYINPEALMGTSFLENNKEWYDI